ncbi:Ser/Thr protein kinase RdoA involved in Cpx stress response, MazF antagonist [Evansella caseinilytica]|uniref:Ser/Thr protein kinase RdoA involved in Cpx stress response, MazF antagonist n=1 Tax=Evansella caseinilytica TaxID=1503961 RepID=A0A1H3HGY5_9BACI|nr:phosphotransferase [Evansella caseinilytica]SDY14088.1 Ser/Thr protein kinase RdoA involved in Cpx stress response, MazF antagonist [Evansella caseinilytica]
MMKLKHLFNNTDLAVMLLNHWEFDEASWQLFKYYRISANAVYPFQKNGERYYLRFSPADEKTEQQIVAELEFLRYLREAGYDTVDTLLSKNGNELEGKDTPWGKYYAVAFKGVPGKPLTKLEASKELFFRWGEALGNLHRLSMDYIPNKNKRPSWEEQLLWMEKNIAEFPMEQAVEKEVCLLRKFFLSLPANKNNFGLIHYDFETDNVFYCEKTKTFHPIDFDDAVYHWYVMDVGRALKSMEEEFPLEKQEHMQQQFLDGYRTAMPLQTEMLELLPVFHRYADLYRYVRCLRSLAETWENEPEWMISLRNHINGMMDRDKRNFGRPLVI